MYGLVLTLHSFVRWLVVIGAVLAVGQALRGWQGKREWGELDDRLGLFFTVTLDVQLLLGIILYIVSPLIQGAMSNFGAAMGDTGLRFFAVEHVALMVVAVVLAHAGRAMAKKATANQHRLVTIFFGLAVIAILVAIPWPFRETIGLGRPWFRLGL